MAQVQVQIQQRKSKHGRTVDCKDELRLKYLIDSKGKAGDEVLPFCKAETLNILNKVSASQASQLSWGPTGLKK
jgi:hypothetical protein